MAWKNGYYYRNRRQGGKVVSEYIGTGAAAELLAQLDAIEQEKLKFEREAFRRLIAEQQAIDEQIDAVGDALTALVDATLLANGYRQHRRQWRKKRE